VHRHRGELLTYLDHEALSPYNNHAEQQSAPPCTRAKSANRTAHWKEQKLTAIFLSLFRSAQLQGLHPVEYVLQMARAAICGESTTDTIAPRQLKKAA